MKGGAEIEMENPRDFSELYVKGHNLDFKSFLPTDIDYDTEDWVFDFLDEPDANKEAANA